MDKITTEILFLTSLGSYYDTKDTLVSPMNTINRYVNTINRYVKIQPAADLFAKNVKFSENGTAYVSDKSFVVFTESTDILGSNKVYIIKESYQTINKLFNFMPTTKNKGSRLIMHARKSMLSRLSCIPFDLDRGIIRRDIKRW